MGLAPLIASFGVILAAELGDKTQIAAITLSARHGARPVFLGLLLAVALVDGLSAGLGAAVGGMLPSPWVGIAAGAVFILFGIRTFLEREEQVEVKERGLGFIAIFSLMALLELGDKTQFSIIALAAKYGSMVLVFLGTMLAYVILTGIGVLVGSRLLGLLPSKAVKAISAAVFLLFGVAFLASALAGVEMRVIF